MKEILLSNHGELFYRFSNADGKIWLMPARNMRVAMNLYQPSGKNGKLVKRLFPWVHWLPLVRRVIRAERVYCDLKSDLKELLCQVFQEKELEFALFGGTPCVHQKITIQLQKGKRIVGYCKATENEEVAQLFQKEAKILGQLERQGVRGIPRCLYCGKRDDGVWLFVQSTVKTQQSQVPHEWTALHESFLEELRKKTLQAIAFEESDYGQTLQSLWQHFDWLPESGNRDIVATALETVMKRYQGKPVDFCAYHADFTPWNMFVEKGELFVFDWEYGRLTYPPMLDKYHFFTQTAYFEKHWSVRQIIDYMKSEEGKWMDKETYSLYLLDVMSRFTLREKGNITGDVAKSFEIWMDLLKYLNQ